MTLPTTTLDAIRSLQSHVGAGNRKRGFREDEELLDDLTKMLHDAINTAHEALSETGQPQEIFISVTVAQQLFETLKRAKVHNQANRLLLMISEIVEAHDETRSGFSADYARYILPTEDGRGLSVAAEHIDDFRDEEARREAGITWDGVSPLKPEGVPSEIADTFIRTLDFADTYGIDLAAIIEEKDAYNATRPFKHGRKF